MRKESSQNQIRRLVKEFLILPIILLTSWTIVYFFGFPFWGISGFWNSVGLYLLIVLAIVLIKHIFLFSKFYKSVRLGGDITNSKQIPKMGNIAPKRLFELNMYLKDESSVDILFKDKKISDKEFILLALLVYAGIIRLMTQKESESHYVFEQTCQALIKSQNKTIYMEDFRQMLMHLKNSL